MHSAFWVPLVRDVITVTGADAASFLHSQLSQDVASMEAGDSRSSFVLEPTGKILSIVRITRGGLDRFVLDTEPGFGDATVARLSRFKIRVDAELELTTQTWRAIRGLRDTTVSGGIAAWRMDGSAFDVFSSGAAMPSALPEGTVDMFHEERLRATWPLMGVDVMAEMIPAETPIVDVAVSFTKGCYPGQELVERMDSRGSRAPRSLVVVSCASTTKPGDEIVVNGESVGVYTSVADVDEGTRAFALVKRGVDLDAVENRSEG
jgi:folate-binding protein YgfZ